MNLDENIHERKWGPRFPIVHALFFWTNSLFCCYLERNAKIQNRRQTPSGRKVSGRKEKERRICVRRGGS